MRAGEFGDHVARRVRAGQSRGSRAEAGKALGVPRTTLLNKIKRYGLK